MDIPLIIAGPIVRRTTSDEVNVWIATSKELDKPELALFDGATKEATRILGDFEYRTLYIAKRLFIYLLTAKPKKDLNTGTNAVYGYDIVLRKVKSIFSKGELEQIVIKGNERPSFLLGPRTGTKLKAIYGSCRKLHGPGLDMVAAAERIIHDRKNRPEYFFLGGDQIYADDVNQAILQFMRPLQDILFGQQEVVYRLGAQGHSLVNSRAKALDRFFTSGHKDHHLVTLAEYACTYLLAWNGNLWKYLKAFAKVKNPPSLSTRRGNPELRELIVASTSMRRVLANVVTYMTFDDHEVTDDWFRSGSWTINAQKYRGAKQIMANGMLAYWAFQGWGNDPDNFDQDFIEQMSAYAERLGKNSDTVYYALKNSNWSFLAPTSPPALFLDTRTKRDDSPPNTYDAYDYRAPSVTQTIGMPSGPIKEKRNPESPRLLGSAERSRIKTLLGGVTYGQPLVVIAASPVFGFPPSEIAQRELGKKDPAAADLENWAGNPRNLADVAQLIVEKGPDPLVILSGDVHYGFEIIGRLQRHHHSVPFMQLCSSALKNQPEGVLGDALVFSGHFFNREEHWIFWEQKSSSNDGPLAWLVANHNGKKEFDRIYSERSFILQSGFIQRDGRADKYGRVETLNNLGQLEIDGTRIWHRHWTSNKAGNKLVPRKWLGWKTEKWPYRDSI